MLEVSEGRGRGKSLEQTGLDLSWAQNLFGMANTTDPRKFYAVTKALLMPSLWNESFGLVAAEAMLNGTPVLASNRGALPETVGEGGLLLDIPPPLHQLLRPPPPPSRPTRRQRLKPSHLICDPWSQRM